MSEAFESLLSAINGAPGLNLPLGQVQEIGKHVETKLNADGYFMASALFLVHIEALLDLVPELCKAACLDQTTATMNVTTSTKGGNPVILESMTLEKFLRTSRSMLIEAKNIDYGQ